MHGKWVVIAHVLREGNMLADYFANLALDKGGVRAISF